MTRVSVEEAAAQLPRLIGEASKGEEVIITQDSEPVARLEPLRRTSQDRKPGSARGLILHMADDFDAPSGAFGVPSRSRRPPRAYGFSGTTNGSR